MKTKNIMLHKKDLAFYEDKLGRTYFARKRRKTAYYIPKDQISVANLYGNRLLLSFFIVVVIGFALKNWAIALFVGLVCYCVAEALYRFKFLPTLDEINYVEFETKRSALDVYLGNSLPKNGMLFLAYTVLPILLVINAKDTVHINFVYELTQDINSLLLVIITLVVVLFCLFQMSRYLMVIIKQITNK